MTSASAQSGTVQRPPVQSSRFAGASHQLWLVFSVFLIAALLNFVIDAPRVMLGLYFLPTLFSAYSYGRRHAVLTALSSAGLIAALTYLNPRLFTHHLVSIGHLEQWFELMSWGGILVITGYAMGTLYERNRTSLEQLRESYHGLLLILQHIAKSDKYSGDHAYRVAVCAVRVAEVMGLNSNSIEDLRAAALLHNVEELGVSIDVLCRAAQLDEDPAENAKKREKAMAGSLPRVIPIVLAHQNRIRGVDTERADIPVEARILAVADTYETLTAGQGGQKPLSPEQAEDAIIHGSGSDYDSRVVDAFIKAFQRRVAAKSAGA